MRCNVLILCIGSCYENVFKDYLHFFYLFTSMTIPFLHQVDLFHAQGNLRDSYSLMDVAYIYSWKRVCFSIGCLYNKYFKNVIPNTCSFKVY